MSDTEGTTTGEDVSVTRRRMMDAVAAAICNADETDPGGGHWGTDELSALAVDAILALFGGAEPYTLGWYHLKRVLTDASWEGRWSPLLGESNIGPLAGHTASVLVDEFARKGLRLVAVAVPASGRQP